MKPSRTPTELQRSRRTSATVRLSAARDAYERRGISKDALRSSCRVCLLAGVKREAVAEVSGLSLDEVNNLQ